MFDPCGSRRVEGEDIIKRLAEHLNVTPFELEEALILLVDMKRAQEEAEDKVERGCGCGD